MQSMTELWPETEQFRTIEDLIEEHAEELERNGGDLEKIPAIAALLAFQEEEFHAHVKRLALKALALKADAEAVKIERVRLQQKESRWFNAEKSIKGYIKRLLEPRDEKKIKTPVVTVSLVNNGGNPSVRVVSEEKLEELYQTGSPFIEKIVTYRLLTDEVLVAHKNGEDIPPEILIERGKHVRIA